MRARITRQRFYGRLGRARPARGLPPITLGQGNTGRGKAGCAIRRHGIGIITSASNRRRHPWTGPDARKAAAGAFVQAYLRRRRSAPSPSRPALSSASVAGSGVSVSSPGGQYATTCEMPAGLF